MKTDVIILGAQKCGTTTLFEILNQHPALAGSSPKEPHFFSDNPDWRDRLPEYEALFPDSADKLRFEGSTTYTFFPHRNLTLWDDLHEYNPDLKFLYLVRRPLARITSAYMHLYERGWLDLPIDEAIFRKPLLLDITRYHTQIAPYIERFGRDRVLLLDFDDFNHQRRAAMNRVAQFLGVDPSGFGEVETVRSNVSVGGQRPHFKYDNPSLPLRMIRDLLPGLWRRITDNSSRKFQTRPQLSPAHRRAAIRLLEPEIDALARLMKKDLSHWKQSD